MPSIKGFVPRGTAARKARIEEIKKRVEELDEQISKNAEQIYRYGCEGRGSRAEKLAEEHRLLEAEIDRLQDEQATAERDFVGGNLNLPRPREMQRAEAAAAAVGEAVPDYMAPFPPVFRDEDKCSKDRDDCGGYDRPGLGRGGEFDEHLRALNENPSTLPSLRSRAHNPGAALEVPDPARNPIFEKVTEERDRLRGEANIYRKEIATLKQQLTDATVQRQRGLMLEAISGYFSNKDWIPSPLAHAAAGDTSLAEQLLVISRERESIANARNDADRVPISGASDLAKKALVQIVWPEYKGWTILMPLRYSLAAVKAAIDVWSQEHMERMEDLKEKTK